MPEGLDVIVVDDDPDVCELVSTTIKRFYTWGKVLSFTDAEAATDYCHGRDIGVAIFVVDVFLGGASGFFFLIPSRKNSPLLIRMPSLSPETPVTTSSTCVWHRM
jgi:response regulator of citrate/malate metabolism